MLIICTSAPKIFNELIECFNEVIECVDNCSKCTKEINYLGHSTMFKHCAWVWGTREFNLGHSCIIDMNTDIRYIIWGVQQCSNSGFGALMNSIWGARALLV